MTSNKDKIIVAAMELFHENGFQKAGLDDILTHSGVCKSNFYYHFKSKDELGIQVIEHKAQELRDLIIGPSLNNLRLTPKQRIMQLFHLMVDFCEGNSCKKGCFFGNMSLELSDHHEGMRRPLSSFFLELEKQIEACLAEGLTKGELTLHGMQPNEAALPIISLLQGSLLLTKAHKEIRPLRQSIQLLQHFLDVG